MVKRFKSLKLAREYAKRTGKKIYNYKKGYNDHRYGHLVVK